MKEIYKEHLFAKRYIVADDAAEAASDIYEVLFSLAALFNIRIVSGGERAQADMIPFVSERIGINVPDAFYRGFPESVKALSTDQLIFDQAMHYAKTYGLGCFDEAGHSVFDLFLQRSAFKELNAVREYRIITEQEAVDALREIVGDLLLSSRPLNDAQYALVLEFMKDHDFKIEKCGSKHTVIRLLNDTRDLNLIRFLMMSDVIKLVEEINYRVYRNENIKKLNLRNRDRKFITRVLDAMFVADKCDFRTCCEKKALWNGLLHHIHYDPKDTVAEYFVESMRGRRNLSVYAEFEKEISERNVKKAAEVLREGKSAATVLRNLDYLLSRCSSREEVDAVLDTVRTDNIIVLTQLLSKYAVRRDGTAKRDFVFTRHNKLKKHSETVEEAAKRRSIVPAEYAEAAFGRLREILRDLLKGRLGKVYIDESMKNIALPIQENTSQGGPGVLPRGSRLAIEKGKKIRAFTYWERVNDIDLSVIGITENDMQKEFSWRTMAANQSAAIAFSGDQTSGYNGGSEFFDVDVDKFRQIYPDIRYLVFCDNVFSGSDFSLCFCKAGFMLRDIRDSGEIFEPKTVESSFRIDCESTFAYLFAVDLEKNDFIWLNSARNGRSRIAGENDMGFLTRYFDVTSAINMYSFFEMMAEELVDDPAKADIIVSDSAEATEGGAEVIRSCDFEKVLALMNARG